MLGREIVEGQQRLAVFRRAGSRLVVLEPVGFDEGVLGRFGLVIVYYGLQVVETMGGRYWEMWSFAWEEGCIVFKPNYMPKKYAMAILPISGVLTAIAALMAVLEDSLRYARGTFRLAGDKESENI